MWPGDCQSADGVTRRRLLGGVGGALAGGLAGCGGRAPSAQATGFGVTRPNTDTSMRWVYPADREFTMGSATVSFTSVRLDEGHDGWDLEFSVTLNTDEDGESASGYTYDLVRFRFWPSAGYDAARHYDVQIGLPTPQRLSVSVGRYGPNSQELVLEVDDISSWADTVTIPAVFDPLDAPRFPAVFHCELTVHATKSGLLGRSVEKTFSNRIDLRECQPDC